MKNKQIINKYIEPIFSSGTIYVVKNPDIKLLSNRFKYKSSNPNEFKDNLTKYLKDYYGITYYGVIEKKTKKYVILIILNLEHTTKQLSINAMAHESLHAAFRMMEYNDLTLNSGTNELFANLVGWITECCYKTYFNIK